MLTVPKLRLSNLVLKACDRLLLRGRLRDARGRQSEGEDRRGSGHLQTAATHIERDHPCLSSC
jgi:hypothetical protein